MNNKLLNSKNIEVYQFGIDDIPKWFKNASPHITYTFSYGSDEKYIESCTLDLAVGNKEIKFGDYVIRFDQTLIYIISQFVYDNLIKEDDDDET